MILSRKFLAILLLSSGALLAACEGAAPAPTGACDYDYNRLMETGWKFFKQFSLEGNDPAEDATTQCIVLFQVNSPRPNSERQGFPDKAPKMIPVMGAAYRKDRDRSRDIHQYELHLPQDMHLGERNVTPRLFEALSGHPGQELVIEDLDADEVAIQASIWKWNEDKNSEASFYKPLGWFWGSAGIKIEKNKVSTFDWLPESRAKLARRKVYIPNDSKNYFRKEGDQTDANRINDPDTVDLVVMVMPPDAQLAISEYPEVLVMAFYERVTMTETARFDPLMDRTAQTMYWQPNQKARTAALSCLVDPDIEQVYVQDVNIDKSPGIPAHIPNTNHSQTDTITVTSLTVFKDKNRKPQPATIVWEVKWDWNYKMREAKWQIVKATAK